MALTKQQSERLAFLEKQVEELAREKHLTEILLVHLQPRVIILQRCDKTLSHVIE
jgi:hypothetical protein